MPLTSCISTLRIPLMRQPRKPCAAVFCIALRQPEAVCWRRKLKSGRQTVTYRDSGRRGGTFSGNDGAAVSDWGTPYAAFDVSAVAADSTEIPLTVQYSDE